MKLWRKFTVQWLEIAALCSFAIAQPLFDLLSKNAEFLVVRRSQPLDIILFVLVVCVALPTAIVLSESLIALMSQRVLPWLHAFLLAALVAVTLLPIFKHWGKLSGRAWAALAFLLGLGFSVAYWRSDKVRSLLLWLSPAVLIFPGFFLFNSPVHKLVFRKSVASVALPSHPSAPVVLVIFDEFPLVSLLDGNQEIDPVLYPNFAGLSRSTTWYRNATSVSEGTLNAVPAILDGQLPRTTPNRLPNATDHPQSLFRLLGNSYAFNVVENSTRLCPNDLCGDQDGSPKLRQRMWGLLSDLSILYLYVALPTSLTRRLPGVTYSWKDFASRLQQGPSPWLVYDELTDWNNRVETFRNFIRSIQPAPKPTLHFLHILLPHAIWEFLPSGKRYALPESQLRGILGPSDSGEDTNQWISDSWTITQNYQRHLLQVELTDCLIGELISHLKTVGLYDPALVVITADHGTSFRPGDFRRSVTETNYPDIMAVPLFVKSPYQKEGETSDRNVETVDIFPTMADILKIELPWKVDGCSVFRGSCSERKEKIIFSDPGQKFVFGSVQAAREESVKHKLSLFGSLSSEDGLFQVGPRRELLGRSVDSFPTTGSSQIECDIDGDRYFSNVNFNTTFVLTHITGQIFRPRQNGFEPLHLAIVANGFIRAMTETYQSEKEERFAALLPESALRSGRNDIEVYVVSEPANSTSLEKIRKLAARTAQLLGGTEDQQTNVCFQRPFIPFSPSNRAFFQFAGFARPAE